MIATQANIEPPKIILQTAMVVFASIDQRDNFGKYSILVAVPDGDGDLNKLKAACEATFKAKFGPKDRARAEMPYKKPDSIDEDMAGSLLISAKSKRQPKLIDRNRQPVADTVLLRGDRIMASVVPYAWTHDGRLGVTLQVRGVLLVERGEAGHIDAEQDFDGVEVPEPVGGGDGETTVEGEVDSSADGDPDGEEF